MDARVVRTKAAVQGALFGLIQEKRWERITVQDLLDRTGISRSTFYAHYDNKLDVLTSGVPEVSGMVTVDPNTQDLQFGGLFEHAEEMVDIFTPLLSQPVLGVISAAVEDSLTALFTELSPADAPATLPRFLAGGTLASIRAFVVDRHRRPPADVAHEIEQYVNGLLRPSR